MVVWSALPPQGLRSGDTETFVRRRDRVGGSRGEFPVGASGSDAPADKAGQRAWTQPG